MMFVFQICLVLISFSLFVQSTAWKCSLYNCGLDAEESMCKSGSSTGTYCEPIVVRPQPVPKPTLTVPTAFTPIPGPCACKKAIVKPAILPKPVCNSLPKQKCCCGEVSSCSCSCQNVNCQCSSIVTDVGGASLALDSTCEKYPEVLIPADAVSIAIAQQQSAQQYCTLDEDRLAFGFRKLPIEIPWKKMKCNNIPEEKIFNLNGQILELKPVKTYCCKSVDQEAVEDLLAWQEDDCACAMPAESCSYLKKISLGELGYVPANIPQTTFIDAPAGAEETAGEAPPAATSSAGYSAGGVVYKTVPKPAPLIIPATEDIFDCDSSEIGEESFVCDDTYTPSVCQYGITPYNCVPCGCAQYQSSSSASTCNKKANLLIQKLCNQE